MPRAVPSHLTRAALLCSVVLLAPLAMADTPATSTPPAAPSAAPSVPLTVSPTRDQTRDDMRARRRADREAFLSARLAALHAGLQLKPDQEALWAPVETAIRGFGKLRAAWWADRKMGMDKGAREGSTDALRKQADRLIARGNAIKSLADATGPLMGSLSSDQKDRLPRLLDGLKPKRVLTRAFALDDRDGRPDAGRAAHEGSDRGMRQEHWAERFDRGGERSGAPWPGDEQRGFGYGHHHGGWDRAERDGMRGDEDMGEGMGRGRPMRRHHDRGDDEPDRT